MNFENQSYKDFLVKINFHRYLEYYKLCHKVLSEDESVDTKHIIIKEIATYLQRSPRGLNLALRSQRNRYDLLHHCLNFNSNDKLNIELFRESYNYVFMKLVEKYLFFIRTIKTR